LTEQREAILLKAIEEGMPLKHAAMLAGISYDSLNRWRIRGESEYAPPEFRDFCNALQRSEAIAMQRLVGRIGDAGKSDWRAAAWILERRFREEFAKTQQVEHSGPQGQPIQTQTTVEPEVLQRIRKQAGLVSLVGELGDILSKNRAKREEERQRIPWMRRARLRE